MIRSQDGHNPVWSYLNAFEKNTSCSCLGSILKRPKEVAWTGMGVGPRHHDPPIQMDDVVLPRNR